jgi:hypothetical protein
MKNMVIPNHARVAPSPEQDINHTSNLEYAAELEARGPRESEQADDTLPGFVVLLMDWSIALGLKDDIPVPTFVAVAVAKAAQGDFPGLTARVLEDFFAVWPVVLQMLGLSPSASMRDLYMVLGDVVQAKGEHFTWGDLDRLLAHVFLTLSPGYTSEEIVEATHKECHASC